MHKKQDAYIIIFDGKCNLCNTSVNFIIRRDKQALFSFTPLQSNVAQSLMQEYKLEEMSADSIILLKNEKRYIRAEAVFEICKDLDGFCSFFRIFKLLPSSLTDLLYRCIAKNRYKVFGKRSKCMIPSEEISSRFLIDPL